MSNIEPTEEQKQAARDFYGLKEHLSLSHELARFLSEREHKLRAELARLHKLFDDAGDGEYNVLALVDHYQKEALGADTLRARVAELEANIRHRCWASAVRALSRRAVADAREAQHKSEVEVLTKRAAEWEVQHGIDRASIASMAESIKRYHDREAQHLADIKALRPLFERVKEAQFENYGDAYRAIYKCGGYDLVKQAAAIFAHYDDAKADAPAVSPDCPRESPECITVGFHAVDECERRTSQAAIEAQDERDTLRARVAELEALRQPPKKHVFWGAGEPDCPAHLKTPRGELHTFQCKVCGGSERTPACIHDENQAGRRGRHADMGVQTMERLCLGAYAREVEAVAAHNAMARHCEDLEKRVAELEAFTQLTDSERASEMFAADLDVVTRAVREADQLHQTVGGSTRHYVNECLLPCLKDEGLSVIVLCRPAHDAEGGEG